MTEVDLVGDLFLLMYLDDMHGFGNMIAPPQERVLGAVDVLKHYGFTDPLIRHVTNLLLTLVWLGETYKNVETRLVLYPSCVSPQAHGQLWTKVGNGYVFSYYFPSRSAVNDQLWICVARAVEDPAVIELPQQTPLPVQTSC